MSSIELFYQDDADKELTVGAEDKFAILIYILVQARIPLLCAELALLQDCLDEKTRNSSETGYRITELQAVVDHLSNLQIEPSELVKDGSANIPSSASPSGVQLELSD